MMKKQRNFTNVFPPLLALLLLLAVWYALTASGRVGAYMLPSPTAVAAALVSQAGYLWQGAKVTLWEAFCGLGIGILIAVVAATVMDAAGFLRRAVYPLLVVSQTVPTIAIAPLLVLWMGFGTAPKIALVALTTFFPISMGLLTGFAAADPDQMNLLRAMGAGRRQIFFHVKWPGALPHFFSGLKISASYAVVGAVVAEWLGGDSGLGMYMTRVRKAYQTDKVFAVIIVIVAVSLLLMLAVHVVTRLSMPWEAVAQNEKKEKKAS